MLAYLISEGDELIPIRVVKGALDGDACHVLQGRDAEIYMGRVLRMHLQLVGNPNSLPPLLRLVEVADRHHHLYLYICRDDGGVEREVVVRGSASRVRVNSRSHSIQWREQKSQVCSQSMAARLFFFFGIR